MSYAQRPTNIYPTSSNSSLTNHTSTSISSLRQPSQSLLQTRINAKRAELDNLRQLRDLSANLANQLSTLEAKLTTLRDGTQSVALVLANWENVLRAISMAATWHMLPRQEMRQGQANANAAVKVPRPSAQDQDGADADVEGGDEGDSTGTKTKEEGKRHVQARKTQTLPVPLVRIPVQPKEEGGG
ncbi:DASH complex subunit dad2 [Exophiala sideris]|uniref:DASH complex subunit DAD2 n=1 Tax=Exophiala sideris TaxID=1016849 RepID=A0ABR0JR86_9EURO|nr:DASH complex subunit dad2 [Exophiala sideris]KAK5041378.1 DASH complex subunit dad2 [Exophiala sideris]KAK5068205.1 DASH complex subunit dad2 [Exophiala sideris]KAK5187506.1 DASH complex subunit dad2 [Eurotiomycetes sp. CCFEE 6388]